MVCWRHFVIKPDSAESIAHKAHNHTATGSGIMRVSGIGALVLAAVARALDTCDCIPGFHEATEMWNTRRYPPKRTAFIRV